MPRHLGTAPLIDPALFQSGDTVAVGISGPADIFNLPRSTPVPGTPEWWYPRTGMIPVGFDSAGNPILSKPAEIWNAIKLPASSSSGITGWLGQNITIVLVTAGALFALAMFSGGRR